MQKKINYDKIYFEQWTLMFAPHSFISRHLLVHLFLHVLFLLFRNDWCCPYRGKMISIEGIARSCNTSRSINTSGYIICVQCWLENSKKPIQFTENFLDLQKYVTFVRLRTERGYIELLSGSVVRGGILLVELLWELALMPVDWILCSDVMLLLLLLSPPPGSSSPAVKNKLWLI